MQTKSLLYARRVKGDLDLGLEPARINAAGARDIARIITPGGRIAGMPEQEIDVASATKNYRIGTRMVRDERVFRYAHIGTTGHGTSGQYGTAVRSTCVTLVRTAPNIISGIMGSYFVTLAIAGVAADHYENGYFGVKHPGGPGTSWGCKILSNTATVAGNVIFTLERPLPFNINLAADTCSVTENPYANCINDYLPNTCKWFQVGFSMCYYTGPNFAFDKWMWLLTWGPLPMTAIASSHEGGLDFERALYFKGQGAVQMPADATGLLGVAGGQHCWNAQLGGYYMADSQAGDQLWPVVWVTIAP